MQEQKENKAISLLENYGQEHIIEVFNQKNGEEKEKLIEQILSISFEQLADLYQKAKQIPELENDKIENIPYVDGQKLSKEERENYKKIGTEKIKNGHYAVVTMAGGQRNKIRSSGTKRNVFNANKARAKVSFRDFNRHIKKK